MQPFTISRALRGTRCWCGHSATVTRTGEGIITHYCARHWALCWSIAFQDQTQKPFRVTTRRRQGGAA